MKNILIKYLAFSYTSKVFGWTNKHLRAVNVIIPLLCFSGLFNLFSEGFGFWDIIVFSPVIIAFLIARNLNRNLPDLNQVKEWEQRLKLMKKLGIPNLSFDDKLEFDRLEEKWVEKYQGKDKFVEVWRFAFPIVMILLSILIYAIFGHSDINFPDTRFF